MTDFDVNRLSALVDDLPSVEEVRGWAKGIVTERNDAFCDQYDPDGLHIEPYERMGEQPRVGRERIRGFMQGGHAIIRRMEIATYPSVDFADPFWNHPERQWTDVRDTSNEIRLPHPLTAPILVRRIEWRSWVSELSAADIEIVTYVLFELEPEQQRKFAATAIDRASRGILTPADEMRAWAAGKL